ncbi:hypothetical protein [Dactylosporangium sp. CA-139066]|uniref:hypothetical protein n=1 Tax=Dactylosporangium sp. CA-139066 TaxID=3239930 RepID=UPI003D94EBDA
MKGRAAVFWTVGGLLALLFVAPLGRLVLASFKSSAEFAQTPPTLLPGRVSLENYRRLPTITVVDDTLDAAPERVALIVRDAHEYAGKYLQ